MLTPHRLLSRQHPWPAAPHIKLRNRDALLAFSRQWQDHEHNANSPFEIDHFFSDTNCTGWHCAACGDEFCRSQVIGGGPPSMLLAVQETDDPNSLVYYAADMPGGWSGHVLHLLRLGNALIDPSNQGVLTMMQPPENQLADDWV